MVVESQVPKWMEAEFQVPFQALLFGFIDEFTFETHILNFLDREGANAKIMTRKALQMIAADNWTLSEFYGRPGMGHLAIT